MNGEQTTFFKHFRVQNIKNNSRKEPIRQHPLPHPFHNKTRFDLSADFKLNRCIIGLNSYCQAINLAWGQRSEWKPSSVTTLVRLFRPWDLQPM